MMGERITAAVAQAYCFMAGTLVMVDVGIRISERPFWDCILRVLLAFLFYGAGAFFGQVHRSK